jgi:hypothetical protein
VKETPDVARENEMFRIGFQSSFLDLISGLRQLPSKEPDVLMGLTVSA